MFGNRIKLFTFRGVPIKVSIWVFVVIGIFMLPSGLLSFMGLSEGLFGILAILVLPLGMFLSVFIHEIAHAIVGSKLGSRVLEIQVDVLGGATLFAARPPTYFRDLLVCLAGPLSNLALWKIFEWGATSLSQGTSSIALLNLVGAFSFLSTINLLLALFNALPIYPFDGGQATYALIMGLTYRQKFAAGVVIALSVVLVAYLVLMPPAFLRGDWIYLVLMWWTAFSIFLSCYGLYQNATAMANFYPLPEQQYEYARKQTEKSLDKGRSGRLFEEGKNFWQTGNYLAALGSFTQAYELEPKRVDYLEQRAAAYLMMQEYEQALNDYNQLIRNAPQKADLYAARARTLAYLGRWSHARADLTQALNLEPQNAQALHLQMEINNAGVR